MDKSNQKMLREVVSQIKEIMIDCFYNDFRLQDFKKITIDSKEYRLKWYEDDCDMICEVTDRTGKLIGFIRHYRFRIWIEYDEGIVKEISLLDPTIIITN